MLSENIPDYVPNAAAAHQAVTVGAAAATLRSLITIDSGTGLVSCKVEGASIRICPTGTTPTGSLGFLVADGGTFELSRREADVAKVIRGTGTDATLQAAQYL